MDLILILVVSALFTVSSLKLAVQSYQEQEKKQDRQSSDNNNGSTNYYQVIVKDDRGQTVATGHLEGMLQSEDCENQVFAKLN